MFYFVVFYCDFLSYVIEWSVEKKSSADLEARDRHDGPVNGSDVNLFFHKALSLTVYSVFSVM